MTLVILVFIFSHITYAETCGDKSFIPKILRRNEE